MRTITSADNQRAELVLCHTNTKGTGCGVAFAVIPSSCNASGGLKVTFAEQTTPTGFDWDNAIVVMLEFEDVSKVLEVLQGCTESINDGTGLSLMFSSGYICTFRFQHVIEPTRGYRFDVCESNDNMKSWHKRTFMLTPAEAMGFSIALENSMSAIAFGLWRW